MANERPLDDAALTRLREDLAAGKRPPLVLLRGGAGLAAGSRGQLVRIDDPPQDAEFLHVKVGNDELPFAPEELGLPGRRTRGAADAAAAKGRAAAAPPPPPAKAAPPVRAPEPILEPVRPDRRTRAERVVTPPPTPAEPSVPEADPAVAERPADAVPSSKARPRRPARAGGPGKITLTLRFAEFGWTVEALVGGRRDKPQPVPLAAIRAFADQLEDQALRRQLDSTVEACREEARKKASALREELARLETELAALDD
jgi:hypothetical protein